MKIYKLKDEYLFELKESIDGPNIKLFFEEKFKIDENNIKEVADIDLPTPKKSY